ncbi:MAG: hypothetical protein U5Q44_08765 [Dehalococcoidia bacterium]|nr:hypothetical protein [Dehalococcoidia bacterium]
MALRGIGIAQSELPGVGQGIELAAVVVRLGGGDQVGLAGLPDDAGDVEVARSEAIARIQAKDDEGR